MTSIAMIIDHARSTPLRRVVSEYVKSMKSMSERFDNFAMGEGFMHMGELPKGGWVETEPGVRTRLIQMPRDLELLTSRLTVMESHATKATRGVRIHCHSTDDVHSNQVIFVEEGNISVSVHDGPNGAVVYRSTYGPGTMVSFTPDQWHSVTFEKGSRIISVFFPSL